MPEYKVVFGKELTDRVEASSTSDVCGGSKYTYRCLKCGEESSAASPWGVSWCQKCIDKSLGAETKSGIRHDDACSGGKYPYRCLKCGKEIEPDKVKNAPWGILCQECIDRWEDSMNRHHEGKPRWDLLAYDTLEEMAIVMTEGAKKHGERDWEKGVGYNDYFSAAMRHLSAWHLGESIDESGHNHLAHAMCDLMIIFANELRQTGEDNRPKLK